MKIFLIGMPGSGKSTLGRRLANILKMPFVDLDEEVVASEGRSIPEIFASAGEDHFRSLESSMLRRWSEKHEDFVMATGGGAPCFHDGINIMNQSGITIYLDVPVEELVKRVNGRTDRPLVASRDEDDTRSKLIALLTKRKSCYSQAKFTTSDSDAEKIAAMIAPKK